MSWAYNYFALKVQNSSNIFVDITRAKGRLDKPLKLLLVTICFRVFKTQALESRSDELLRHIKARRMYTFMKAGKQISNEIYQVILNCNLHYSVSTEILFTNIEYRHRMVSPFHLGLVFR